jgi:acyl-CoA thioester hydrolase
MARVTIELPESFLFSTEIPVRITDLNYGQHLGNDSMLSLLHEARVRWLRSGNFTEEDIAGVGLIMVDAAVVYKEEVHYGDVLRIEVAVTEMGRVGFEVVYRVTKSATGELAAQGKTGMACFDYTKKKMQRIPQAFINWVSGQQ